MLGVMFLLNISKHFLCFFYGSFFVIMFSVCHPVWPVHCSLVVTCWERAGLLSLVRVMFSCVFIVFPCGVLGQVWYLIVLIPEFCFLPYFTVDVITHAVVCFSNQIKSKYG